LTDEQKDAALYAAIVLGIATAGYLAFVLRTSLPTRPWYYLPWMAVAAVAFETVVRLWLPSLEFRLAGLGLATLLLGLMIAPANVDLRIRQTNVDKLAAVLEKDAAPEDLILLPGWFHAVSFQRYYHGATPWMTVPPLTDHTIHRYDLIKQQMVASAPLDPVLAAVKETMASGHRVWVIGVSVFPADGNIPPSLPPAPGGPRGWEADAYLELWQLQVGAFLHSNSRRFRQVPVPDVGAVNPDEFLPLYVGDGWHAPAH
jgi:hypothetical protein